MQKSRFKLALLGSLGLGIAMQPAFAEAPASPEAKPDSWNFERVGEAVGPDGKMDRLGYSKISPWPQIGNRLYSGCYPPGELSKESAADGQCFMILDTTNPRQPVRRSVTYAFDPVASPPPPRNHVVWTKTYPFPNLPTRVPCKVDWSDPGIASGKVAPACWDPGWNTHTHYVAIGPNNILAVNQERYRYGTDRQQNYRGVKFYDVSDASHPKALSYWEAKATPADPNTGVIANGMGVHHFTWDGRFLYLGSEMDGFVGKILVTLDLADPRRPREINRWWVPGQKRGTEDALRDWEQQDLFNQPVTRLPSGKLARYVGMHYVAFDGKGHAFLAYHQAGLVTLDIRNRRSPKLLSRLDYIAPGGDPGSLDAEACRKSAGGQEAGCGNSHTARLIPGTSKLVVDDEYFVCPYGSLRLVDVSDLRKPRILSRFMTDRNAACSPEKPRATADAPYFPKRGPSSHLGNAWNKDIYLMAWYGMGVEAIDFSDPLNPKEVGRYHYRIGDDYGNASPSLAGTDTYDAVFDANGYIYVSDGTAGLRVVRYTGPGADQKYRDPVKGDPAP
jgi:hypothetical protein